MRDVFLNLRRELLKNPHYQLVPSEVRAPSSSFSKASLIYGASNLIKRFFLAEIADTFLSAICQPRGQLLQLCSFEPAFSVFFACLKLVNFVRREMMMAAVLPLLQRCSIRYGNQLKRL